MWLELVQNHVPRQEGNVTKDTKLSWSNFCREKAEYRRIRHCIRPSGVSWVTSKPGSFYLAVLLFQILSLIRIFWIDQKLSLNLQQ